jgi:hypothetical protein
VPSSCAPETSRCRLSRRPAAPRRGGRGSSARSGALRAAPRRQGRRAGAAGGARAGGPASAAALAPAAVDRPARDRPARPAGAVDRPARHPVPRHRAARRGQGRARPQGDLAADPERDRGGRAGVAQAAQAPGERADAPAP